MRNFKTKFQISIFSFLFIFLFSSSFISATDFYYDNPSLPSLKPPTTTTTTINNVTGSTNSSDYWDNLDTTNSTQFDNSGSTLSILESWLTSFVDNWFTSQTTDDLAEGTTNLYDNQSWNESRLWDTTFNASFDDRDQVGGGGGGASPTLNTTNNVGHLNWTRNVSGGGANVTLTIKVI